HVGRNADEGAQRRRRLDAVLAAVPSRFEDARDLLEVVHEELLRLLAKLLALAGAAKRGFIGKQLLQLLCERRLADAALAHAEQLDLAEQRRLLAIVDGADDVVRRGERFVAIEL